LCGCFFQAEDGIRDRDVTGVQTCALPIYIFSKKVHIKDIDLAEYLTDPFIFEGPKTMATDFEFMMPDSTIKHIYIQPSTCEMEVRWKEIVTRCEVEVSDKPFK